MEFHEWTTYYEVVRSTWPNGRGYSADEFYTFLFKHPNFRKMSLVGQEVYQAEALWYQDGRPYYSIYPSIIESLVRLRLDVDCGSIPDLPVPVLAVRFAKGHELPDVGQLRIRSILLTMATTETNVRCLAMYADVGNRKSNEEGTEFPLSVGTIIGLPPNTTLEESIQEAIRAAVQATPSHPVETSTDRYTLIKLACTLCLLGNDPEIIEPDVLAKDREKWERTRDPAIVERAVRRGKRGWLVGARIEVIPHVRRPHMALRWTGPGGAVPKIVPVKGSIVHREKIEKLPTGRMDESPAPPDSSPIDLPGQTSRNSSAVSPIHTTIGFHLPPGRSARASAG